MSTIEDFENAPVGATATAPNGNIAVKTERRAFEWSMYDSRGRPWYTNGDMSSKGFALNPAIPATAREALDLAWNLAHPVKEGQHIPAYERTIGMYEDGDFYLERVRRARTASVSETTFLRTLDPLPEPEPDWLDAPAVLAAMNDCSWQKVWLPKPDGNWECTCCGVVRHWSKMTDVTPLYPKGQEA